MPYEQNVLQFLNQVHTHTHTHAQALTWTAGATAPDATSASPADGPPLVKKACISCTTERVIAGAAGPASPSRRYGCVADQRRLSASPLSSRTSGTFEKRKQQKNTNTTPAGVR